MDLKKKKKKVQVTQESIFFQTKDPERLHQPESQSNCPGGNEIGTQNSSPGRKSSLGGADPDCTSVCSHSSAALTTPGKTVNSRKSPSASTQAGWDQNKSSDFSFPARTISVSLSWGVQSKVQLLSEGVPVISVDELKHTLVNHIRLRTEEAVRHVNNWKRWSHSWLKRLLRTS